MGQSLKNWIFACKSCGFLMSSLQPRIEASSFDTSIDEGSRFNALEQLRINNFRRILTQLSTIAPAHGKRLLDVGCAHGWFLDIATQLGFIVNGIEPDPGISILAAKSDRRVWQGFFPDDLPEDQRFDVIVFNDVFEHLPYPSQAIAACHHLLEKGGILVINIPNSNGVFYRLAELLSRLGISTPLERMWQKQFPSPHLSYFNPSQLKQLAEENGFIECHRSTLPSIELKGLWTRLRYDRSTSFLYSALVWLGVVAFFPLIRILPADISLQMFRKLG